MGVVEGINITDFPKQSNWLHGRVKVCFDYDVNKEIGGTVVRCDLSEPFETLIRLDDGRYVRSKECQYTPTSIDPPTESVLDAGRPVTDEFKARHRAVAELLKQISERAKVVYGDKVAWDIGVMAQKACDIIGGKIPVKP